MTDVMEAKAPPTPTHTPNAHRAPSKRRPTILRRSRNRLERAVLPGGLIGLFMGNPRKALGATIERANAEGWNVQQVMPDAPSNLVEKLLRVVLLVGTLFLYTTADGYLIVLEKEVE